MKHKKGNSTIRNSLRQLGVYALITIVTLAVFDMLLISLDLFPPQYEFGNPALGWATNAPRTLPYDSCVEMTTRTRVRYYRNELGIRTPLTQLEIGARNSDFIIGALGDSQSDQCAENEDTHQGVLETELSRQGMKTLVLSNGVGRYSPLQSYLLFKGRLRRFNPDALVLNLYTGNDFIDMLRVDDRPHFTPLADGYEVAPPVWYRYYDPAVKRSSRVMFVARSIMDAIGIRNLWLRFRLLSDSAVNEGEGLRATFDYLIDIRRSIEPSIGYRAAYAAQFLNQQLYIHHFPGSESEALRRTRALMRVIREENPNLMLIMSPIPSYQLVGEQPVDAALLQTLQRLPLTHADGIAAEERLYYALREMSEQEGWLFVDLLQPLRAYQGAERLYNDFDYHVTSAASQVIGLTEAAIIMQHLASADSN